MPTATLSPGAPVIAASIGGHARPIGRPLAVRDLSGLRPADIVSLLGQPDLTTDEPPAEIWQYRSPDCVLNLFFYDNAGGATVIHTETWQRSLGAGPAPAPCRDGDAPLRAHLITQSAL